MGVVLWLFIYYKRSWPVREVKEIRLLKVNFTFIRLKMTVKSDCICTATNVHSFQTFQQSVTSKGASKLGQQKHKPAKHELQASEGPTRARTNGRPVPFIVLFTSIVAIVRVVRE